MNARPRKMVLFGAVGLVAAGFALLVAQRAGAAPADIGDCFQLDGAGCIEGATDLAGTASGAIGGVSTALGGPDEWLKSIVTSAGEAVELSFGLVQSYLTNAADPELVAPWFADGPYASAIGVAAMLATLAAFAEIIRASVKGELGGLAGRIMLGLPAMAIVIGIAPTVLQTVVSFVDAISSGIMSTSRADLRGFSDSILERTGDGADGVGGAVIVLLVQMVLIISLLATALALVLRQVAAYLLVVMIPISAMGVVFEPVRKFATRTVEVLFAVIFSKIVIALALSIGSAALAGAVSAPPGPPPAATPPAAASSTTAPAQQQDGVALVLTGLAGIVTYGAAAFAPIGLLMLIPSAEAAAMSMRGVRQAGSEARQSAGAVSGVDRAKGTAGQMAMMGVSAGVSTAVAGGLGGGASGGGGSGGAAGGGTTGGGGVSGAVGLPPGSSGGPGNGAQGLPPGDQDSGTDTGAPPAVPGGEAPTPSGTSGSRPGGTPPPYTGPTPTAPSGTPDPNQPGPPPPPPPPPPASGPSGSPGSRPGGTPPPYTGPPPSPPSGTPDPSQPGPSPAPSGSPGSRPGGTPPPYTGPPPSPPSPGPAPDPSDRTTGDPR